jgi:hypothetical protein
VKILKTKKFANMYDGRDPYKCDFAHEREKAERI